MFQVHRIPAKLNGFDIIAALPKILPNGQPSDKEVVILGHDATRRNSKYVTAYVDMQYSPHRSIREWFWGNYMEELDVALKSLITRASINTEVEIQSFFQS